MATDAFAALITKKKYSEQAIWFLNGFWSQGMDAYAEQVWQWSRDFAELDAKNNTEGHELDEFEAHRFLEKMDATMTVMEMRKKMREIDTDSNGKMAMLEWLLYYFSPISGSVGPNEQEIPSFDFVSMDAIVNAPQGGDQAELDRVQAMFEELNAQLQEQIAAVAALDQAVSELEQAVNELNTAIAETEAAVAELNAAIENTKTAVAETQAAVAALAEEEATLQAAQEELQTAMDDLQREEDAYHGAIAACEEKINDDSLGVVKKNRAKAELAQLQAEDPMPLQRAKITQGAAIRKVEKAKKKVQEKKAETEAKQAEQEALQAEQEELQRQTEQKKAEQEQKKAEQEQKQAEMEAAKADAEAKADALAAKLEEVGEQLEILKQQEGSPEGALWYFERDAIHMDSFLPTSQQRWPELHKKVNIRA